MKSKAKIFLESGYVGYGEINKTIGLPLKYVNILMNGLLLYISLLLFLALVQTHNNLNFIVNGATEIPILFTISYSILNTLFLYKIKGKYINKVVSQNLIYSTALCIVLLGYVKNLFFISSFSWLIISAITLWRIILPYVNNFKNPIKHADFLTIFSTNIVIVFYSIYFDYWSGIKTLGLPLWILLFIGSTFWQLYYLDTKDNFFIVGNTFNKMAEKTRIAYHKYYPEKNLNK